MASYGQMSVAREWSVYVIAEEGDAFCKIGSASTPAYRLSGLQNGNPRRLRMVRTWRVAGRSAALAVEDRALINAGLLRLDRRDWLECTPDAAVSFIISAMAHLNVREVA